MVNYKIVTFSLNKRILAKLDFLAETLCLKKSTLLSTIINKEYTRVKQELYRNKMEDIEVITQTLEKNSLESDLLIGDTSNDNLSMEEDNEP